MSKPRENESEHTCDGEEDMLLKESCEAYELDGALSQLGLPRQRKV